MVKRNSRHGGWRSLIIGASALLLADIATISNASASLENPFFKAQEVASRDLAPFSKWLGVLTRYTTASDNPVHCKSGDCPQDKWNAMLDAAKGKNDRAKMEAVNTFFNQVSYVEDRDNWGIGDYWATPLEMLERGGDCEDYAIAKYLSLKKLGFRESDMRVVIVQDQNLGGDIHAVLEVRLNGKRYLLDNQISTVVEQQRVFHYNPVYALNSQQWWAYQ